MKETADRGPEYVMKSAANEGRREFEVRKKTAVSDEGWKRGAERN